MFVAATDKGCIRDNNEDSYYIPGKIENIFILADGMGGHLAGETASQMAVQTIVDYFSEENINSDEELERVIVNSVKMANEKIFNLSREDIKYRGMGTTLSMCYIYDGYLYYVNIGDSRIYEINCDEINQITTDDSFVNYLIQIGEITEQEAKEHPKKNVLTKALGTSETIEVTVNKLKINKNTKYLLCSDGLTNMVDEKEILEIINKYEIEIAKDKLIKETLLNGGIDNVTLIIIDNK
ncbi:Stp1/IreP family PP2C-type Ser/Thr phosphatase [Peptoniphilus mikwangii]|uniref:Stp1/IreP family PP2C-type Ser/Thr phosphatase n=1 Tax=Peptoniphilus mikwangii TaxID=1354300 RepID=UPI0004220C8E|nr:Stp1/IreP family PP2C-type Ser/Thr phosphatase [Peptoniphilus mikwangii]